MWNEASASDCGPFLCCSWQSSWVLQTCFWVSWRQQRTTWTILESTSPSSSRPGTTWHLSTRYTARAQTCVSVSTCVVCGMCQTCNTLMLLVSYRTRLCWRVTTGDQLWECCESQDCCPICLLTCRKCTHTRTCVEHILLFKRSCAAVTYNLISNP